jgi:hypothetical protein
MHMSAGKILRGGFKPNLFFFTAAAQQQGSFSTVALSVYPAPNHILKI